MQVATEVAQLAQRLVTLELRAAGLRAPVATSPWVAPPLARWQTAPDNGAELRQLEREHGALLFEHAKVLLRDVLTSGPHVGAALVDGLPTPPTFVTADDPLGSAAARVGVALAEQLRQWRMD